MRFVRHLPIIAALFLSACAHNMYLPTNRFQSPEAQGANWATTLGAGAFSAVMMDPIQDISASPPVVYPPQLTSKRIVLPYSDFGIGERFDWGLRLSANETPWMIRVKYQIMGQPRRVAETGNFSFSVGAGWGELESGYAGGWNWFGLASTATVGATYRSSKELYAGMGYRPNELLLIYADFTHSYHASSGTLTRTSSVGSTSSIEVAFFSSEGFENTIHVGTYFYFAPKTFVAIEGAQTTVYWSAVPEKSFSSAGAALGVAL